MTKPDDTPIEAQPIHALPMPKYDFPQTRFDGSREVRSITTSSATQMPQDVWDAALSVHRSQPHLRHEAIARAIMAEREAIAVFIEQRDGLIPERQEIAAAIRKGV